MYDLGNNESGGGHVWPQRHEHWTYISEWFITFAIDNYRIVGGVCGALRAYYPVRLNNKETSAVRALLSMTQWTMLKNLIQKWYYVSKIVLTYYDIIEKYFLISLEPFIQAVKG